jgi:hypothetical protein
MYQLPGLLDCCPKEEGRLTTWVSYRFCLVEGFQQSASFCSTGHWMGHEILARVLFPPEAAYASQLPHLPSWSPGVGCTGPSTQVLIGWHKSHSDRVSVSWGQILTLESIIPADVVPWYWENLSYQPLLPQLVLSNPFYIIIISLSFPQLSIKCPDFQ